MIKVNETERHEQGRGIGSSQSFVLTPRLVASSLTPRRIVSLTPDGTSAAISRVTRIVAFGSAASRRTISSAIGTRRIFAAAAGT
jgi:hypothetical protein